MPTKQFSPIFLFILAFLLTCCDRNKGLHPLITRSADQVVSIRLPIEDTGWAGIIFGNCSEQTVDKWAPCSGYLVLSQENSLVISAPAPGIIKSVNCAQGVYVEAGTLLACLENAEFLKLKQEYLEAENQFEFMQEEYKRQGELTVENATSVKTMQVARRDYQTAELKLHAIRTQLGAYGILADSLKFNQLTSLIDIKAPRSGYIAGIRSRQGSYVNLGEELLVMCNNPKLQVKLYVPEQFTPDLKTGQSVDFFLAHDSLSAHKAVLKYRAHRVDPVSHTAEVSAGILDVKDFFLPGMSVKARIRTHTIVIKVIPTTSILNDSKGNYLFVKNQGVFTRIPIRIGNSHGEFTEILDFPGNDKKDSVVLQGGKYLDSLLQNP